MRHFLRCLALLSVFAVPANAFADTLNFYLNGTLQGGGAAAGVFSVDRTLGYVGLVNVTVIDHGTTYLFNEGIFFQQPYVSVTPTEFYAVSYDRAGDNLLFSFPGLLVGYTGGALCSTSNPCKGFTASSVFLSGGPFAGTENFTSLTATPVPEMSTMSLVLTGVLGVAGTLRRRFAGIRQDRLETRVCLAQRLLLLYSRE